MSDNSQSAGWSSRWTFMMAATGSATGLNIWKFPYIIGEYGGAFVWVYLACILLVGIPIMMAEILIGRRDRTDPVNAMAKLASAAALSRGWALVGVMGVLSGLLILMFYTVVGGWGLDYLLQSLTASYVDANPAAAAATFTTLTTDTNKQLIWHTLFTLMTVAVVARGVVKGIGATSTVLLPLLLVLLLVLAGYSWSVGDFGASISFIFTPDFSKLSGEAVLVAISHAFLTLGLGMGAMMVYGSYMPGDAPIAKTALTVAALNTMVALLAGLAIFALVFANDLAPDSGPGLMFVTLPVAFGHMTAGAFFGSLFFALVTMAALTSAISLLEPAVSWFERQGGKRLWGATGLGFVCWLGGIGSIHSADVFNFFDHFTASFTLPMGGLAVAIFVGWKIRRNPVRKDLGEISEGSFNIWYVVLRFIAPTGLITALLHSLGLM